MEQWIQHVLSGHQIGLAFFPAVFLLGVLGAVSSCCALPVIGAVVGYAGSRDARNDRRELLIVGLFFMLGMMAALAAVGAITGFVGQVASASMGRYWRFASGLLLVLFGLISLNLLRFRIPKIDLGRRASNQSIVGAMAYGLALGGASTACSVGCNPLLPMVVGASILNSTILMSAMSLTVFALGYSLPIAAGLIGISLGLGRLSTVAQRAMPVIRIGAGVLLVGVGFYLLATV